jgi:hypothetical protein
VIHLFYKESQIKNFWHHNDEDNKQTNVVLLLSKSSFHIVNSPHYCWHVINLKWHQIKCLMLVTQLNCNWFNIKLGWFNKFGWVVD